MANKGKGKQRSSPAKNKPAVEEAEEAPQPVIQPAQSVSLAIAQQNLHNYIATQWFGKYNVRATEVKYEGDPLKPDMASFESFKGQCGGKIHHATIQAGRVLGEDEISSIIVIPARKVGWMVPHLPQPGLKRAVGNLDPIEFFESTFKYVQRNVKETDGRSVISHLVPAAHHLTNLNTPTGHGRRLDPIVAEFTEDVALPLFQMAIEDFEKTNSRAPTSEEVYKIFKTIVHRAVSLDLMSGLIETHAKAIHGTGVPELQPSAIAELRDPKLVTDLLEDHVGKIGSHYGVSDAHMIATQLPSSLTPVPLQNLISKIGTDFKEKAPVLENPTNEPKGQKRGASTELESDKPNKVPRTVQWTTVVKGNKPAPASNSSVDTTQAKPPPTKKPDTPCPKCKYLYGRDLMHWGTACRNGAEYEAKVKADQAVNKSKA